MTSQERFLKRIWRNTHSLLDSICGTPERIAETQQWIDTHITSSNSGDFDTWLRSSEADSDAVSLVGKLHTAVERVTEGTVNQRVFNVSISELMILSNAIEDAVNQVHIHVCDVVNIWSCSVLLSRSECEVEVLIKMCNVLLCLVCFDDSQRSSHRLPAVTP